MTQSQLDGYPANLLLSLSLIHASQAAAARISKENSGLFKHPTQKHAHTLQASESGGARRPHISPHALLPTYTHIRTLWANLWAVFVKPCLS